MIVGLILIAIGIIAILMQFGIISGSLWSYIWPIILIVIGLAFLWGRRRRGGWWRGPRGDNDRRQ